ncbi:MAG: hypothetical protein ACYCYM_00440 [Saccharofermentanales bacterium]
MTKKIAAVLAIVFLCTAGLMTACNETVTDTLSEQGSVPSGPSDGSATQSSLESTSTADSVLQSSDGSTAGSQISSVGETGSQTSSSGSKSQVSSAASSAASSSAASSSVASSSTAGSSVASSSTAGSSVASSSTAGSKKYYLAGSWNGYTVDDALYQMVQVSGTQNWYTATVALTADNRDELYDGHWYKVTEGNWNHSYGIDEYIQQPAPVKKDSNGNAIGLGSIWIDENLTLTVMFDSADAKVYDNANGKVLPTP